MIEIEWGEIPNDLWQALFIIFVMPAVLLIGGLAIYKRGDPAQFGVEGAKASVIQSVSVALAKGLDFKGRASRSEFWGYFLVSFAVVGSLAGLFTYFGHGNIGLYLLALASVPGLAIGTRRLHDISRSGWWQISLIAPVGIIVMLILWSRRSPKPSAIAQAQAFE